MSSWTRHAEISKACYMDAAVFVMQRQLDLFPHLLKKMGPFQVIPACLGATHVSE